MTHPRSLQPGEQLAMPLEAGAEVFCTSGAVRLSVMDSSGLPLSIDLAAGRGWRCGESTRVLLAAHRISRVLIHEPQRQRKSPAVRGLPDAIWSRFRRALRAA